MWRRLFWWTTDRPAVLPWVVLLSALLLISGDSMRQGISAVAVEYVYAPFFAMKYRIAASARVFEENRDLRRQLAEANTENQRLREGGAENERLRRLLNLSGPWHARAIAAEVVAPISIGSGVMWIDIGGQGQMEPGWPVATEAGLVGKIVEVRGNLARVRTLWDRLSRIAVFSLRTRAAGIVAWEEGQNLKLTYVLPHTDIRIGDSLISSGWGGVFPKGLRIGTIASVDSTAADDFLGISVEPVSQPNSLEQVFVIRPDSNATDSVWGGLAP